MKKLAKSILKDLSRKNCIVLHNKRKWVKISPAKLIKLCEEILK